MEKDSMNKMIIQNGVNHVHKTIIIYKDFLDFIYVEPNKDWNRMKNFRWITQVNNHMWGLFRHEKSLPEILHSLNL